VALGLGALEYCVPLELWSTVFWFGVSLTLISVVNCARPIRQLGFQGRALPAALAGLGVGLGALALLWPVTPALEEKRTSGLDRMLPGYDLNERHELEIEAPVVAVMAALREVKFGELPVYDRLLRLRALAVGRMAASGALRDERVLGLITRGSSGFVMLEAGPEELVIGMAGRPWLGRRSAKVRDATEWRAFQEAGAVRIAFNLRAEALGAERTRLSTETRIQGTDSEGTRRMAAYWRVIRPGSGWIRRQWLEAVARHAVGRM